MNNLNLQNLTQGRVCPHGRHGGRFDVLKKTLPTAKASVSIGKSQLTQ